MSRETLEWLNDNTLIGFTETRGNAWHYRQGADNHFEGPVPVEEVRRRLFHWTAEERPLYVSSGTPGDPLRTTDDLTPVTGRKAIVRSDNGHVLGIHGDGYSGHQYDEWLIRNVEFLLDAGLTIGSAGLLRGGAIAWVSVEVPETFSVAGVPFRPSLMARSAFDGSISTTYGRHVTNVVCDNTMAIAAGEHGGQQVKVKATKNSKLNVIEAREAVGLLFTMADDFGAQVEALVAQEVSDDAFDRLIAQEFPMPPPSPPDANKGARAGRERAATLAAKKRGTLRGLWLRDERVTPWRGNAFGAWQAFNTYAQHEASFKGGNRAERNMLNVVTGKADQQDQAILAKLAEVS